MKSISFFAEGTPKGQPRMRAFARKFGAKWSARVYDPGTAEGWKSQIAIAARDHIDEPFVNPVRLEIVFNFPRPKCHFRRDGTVKAGAPRYHATKPDTDNAVKAVMDALTQLGMWRDDKQVVSLIASKTYAFGSSAGGASVTISEMENIT